MTGYLFVSCPTKIFAETVTDLAQVCAGCHGEKGIPVDKTIPVIWGQRREYLLKELHDFKVGHRKNETMSAIVASLSMGDMEALSSYFSEQQWPVLRQRVPSTEEQNKADAVFNSMNCRSCHQEYFQGDYSRPRLGGQQEEYLLKTMTDFRDGKRTNYPGMTALLKAVDEQDLKPVAAYLANHQVAPRIVGER